MLRVLITGMSGTGKSALVQELRRRGYAAYDADDDGYTEARADGRWGWRLEAVRELLGQSAGPVLFFAGCSEEQSLLEFDLRVLLSVPVPLLVERLGTRTTNAYGRTEAQLQRVLADRDAVEPLLRRRADLVIETVAPIEEVAAIVLRRVAELG